MPNTEIAATETIGTEMKENKPDYTINQPEPKAAAVAPKLATVCDGLRHSPMEMLSLGLKFSNFQFGDDFPKLLVPDHYRAFSKINLENQIKSGSGFKLNFKEFCPQVFRELRHRFGVMEESYMLSLGEVKETEMAGRSGSAIFLSNDKKFIIKCITKEELVSLRKILPAYRDYVVENGQSILLPRYLGVYRVKIDKSHTSKYMCVTNNVFSDCKMVEKYDLKGSTVARTAAVKKENNEKNNTINPDMHTSQPVLKDNDFRSTGRKLNVKTEEAEMFLKDLQRDTEFLAHNKLMDYSLLVGVTKLSTSNKRNGCCLRILSGTDPEENYFVGLIDCLTDYSKKKQMAHSAKLVKHGTKHEISTVNPTFYAKRINEYIISITSGMENKNVEPNTSTSPEKESGNNNNNNNNNNKQSNKDKKQIKKTVSDNSVKESDEKMAENEIPLKLHTSDNAVPQIKKDTENEK